MLGYFDKNNWLLWQNKFYLKFHLLVDIKTSSSFYCLVISIWSLGHQIGKDISAQPKRLRAYLVLFL